MNLMLNPELYINLMVVDIYILYIIAGGTFKITHFAK